MPHFAYQAGLDFIRLPILAGYDELLTFMQETNTDYLFFSHVAQRTRPELGSLMNPNSDHPGLVVVAASPIGVLYAIDKRGRDR
jgi:hypothetical protein